MASRRQDHLQGSITTASTKLIELIQKRSLVLEAAQVEENAAGFDASNDGDR
jgi:hypothetical protein